MTPSKPPGRCHACGRRYKRSTESNRRLWLLYHLAAAKLRPGGIAYSAEQYHLYYKSKLLGCTDFPLPNGQVLVIPHSTADLDVSEFADFMAQVEADLAEREVYLEEMPQ